MPLAGGPVAAAAILVRRRRNPHAVLALSYRGAPLYFRGIDSSALEEVLSDEEYGFLRPYLQAMPAPRILDVGGHIGTFALWALGASPSAQILSVEANADTLAVAQRTRTARGDATAGWDLVNRAAGARDGERLPFLAEGPSMSHRVDAAGALTVEAVSLAGLLRRVAGRDGTVDLLKVDIEGSEEAFLCTDPGLLARVERLVVELHPGRCDTARVRRVLAGTFDDIVEIPGRRSTKPLLDCRRHGGAATGEGRQARRPAELTP